MNDPRTVFMEMREHWLFNLAGLPRRRLAEDVVVETPFAPPGAPRRIQGRDEFLTFAETGRAALPVQFDECREVAIHDTADPEVIVVEYELGGVVTTTGERQSAPFIGVLQVRDGKVIRWREYQDMAAIGRAVSGA